jgi:hypothetical protein
MRRTIFVAVIALMVGCKKEKAAPAGAASAAPSPTEGTTPTPTTPAPGARPAAVTEAQASAYEKYAIAVEAFGKDVGGAGADCAKIAAVMGTHSAAIKAAQEASLAAKIDDTDAAIKAWLGTTYGTRMAASMAAYGTFAAKCATDKAFVAAAAAMNLSALTLGQSADAVDKALDDYGAAMDKAGKALDNAGKAVDTAGKAADEAGKAADEAGKE